MDNTYKKQNPINFCTFESQIEQNKPESRSSYSSFKSEYKKESPCTL